MNKALHEGGKECWHDLKLRKFRPRSCKTQALKVGLRKGGDTRRGRGKNIEDTEIEHGIVGRAQNWQVAA